MQNFDSTPPHHAQHDPRIIHDSGVGRVFIILCETPQDEPRAIRVASSLEGRARSLVVITGEISDSNWKQKTEQLIELIRANGVRQSSFVGLGDAASIAQYLTMLEPKSVRTLILVDATSRSHPTRLSRFIDRVEELLPLGLPLRMKSEAFDSKPFLQRIRCPTLIVTSIDADPFLDSQSQMFAHRIPTSWPVKLSSPDPDVELAELVIEFEQIPAKCPQKRVAV